MSEFYDSLKDENVLTDLNSMPVGEITFYSIKISTDTNSIHLFRQFTKLKNLRKGFFARIWDNELKVLDDDLVGIDNFIDLVHWNDEILILNHIALERIMEYKSYFLEQVAEAINLIKSKNIIENIEEFERDCLNDIRIAKRFTQMMSKERLPLFFENYEKVPEIVASIGLDIEFRENEGINQLIYEGRSQLFSIVHLLSDDYFKSLLCNRVAVSLLEKDV